VSLAELAKGIAMHGGEIPGGVEDPDARVARVREKPLRLYYGGDWHGGKLVSESLTA
jgi:hypothetical protein